MRYTFCLTVIITMPYNKIHSKRLKAVDNIELDTGNKLQRLKILLPDRFLKSLKIFGKYINGIFETGTTGEKDSFSYTLYL